MIVTFDGFINVAYKLNQWMTTEELKMSLSLDEIHPGEILLEDFMKPMGITARQLAADIDVSPSRISDLVNGNRPVTADTALRLGLFFQHGASLLAQPSNRVRHAPSHPNAHCCHCATH
jgi:addiction module HigA family antidote